MNFPSRRYHSGKEVETLQGLELVQTIPNSKVNKHFHIEWPNRKTSFFFSVALFNLENPSYNYECEFRSILPSSLLPWILVNFFVNESADMAK